MHPWLQLTPELWFYDDIDTLSWMISAVTWSELKCWHGLTRSYSSTLTQNIFVAIYFHNLMNINGVVSSSLFFLSCVSFHLPYPSYLALFLIVSLLIFFCCSVLFCAVCVFRPHLPTSVCLLKLTRRTRSR